MRLYIIKYITKYDRDFLERDFFGDHANIIEYDTFVSFLFIITLNLIIQYLHFQKGLVNSQLKRSLCRSRGRGPLANPPPKKKIGLDIYFENTILNKGYYKQFKWWQLTCSEMSKIFTVYIFFSQISDSKWLPANDHCLSQREQSFFEHQ